jgi:hypothetical protein
MHARRTGAQAVSALAVGALVAGSIALSAPAGAVDRDIQPRSTGYQYGNWSAVGAGFSGNPAGASGNTVYGLARSSGGGLIAAGTFVSSGGATANRVAQFTGSAWGSLAAEIGGISRGVPTVAATGNQPATPGVYGFDLSGDDTIFAGGQFQFAGDDTVNNVARWTGAGWQRMGIGLQGNSLSNGAVVQDMLVGNDPSHADDTTYADDTVYAIGGMAGVCPSLNSCSNAGGTSSFPGVMQYRQADDTWLNVGSSTFDRQPITGAFISDSVSGDDTVIVAGEFTTIGGTRFNRIAAFSHATNSWSHLGSGNFGFNDSVYAATVHPTTGDVYVAGKFTALCSDATCTAGTQIDISDGVAKWDRQANAWYSVGNGIGSPNLDDIGFSPDGSVAYVVGFGGSAGGSNINGIATISGADFNTAVTNVSGTWSYINSVGVVGTNGNARSVVVNNDGSVYVGGGFTQAGPTAAANVALFTPGQEPSPFDPVFPAAAPTDVVATGGWNKVTVDWTPPTYTGSYPITNYLVQASPGGRVCITRLTDPKLNQCTYTSLTPGTNYTFTVQALNGAGWGDRSAASNVASPQNLRITSRKRVKLNFFLGGGSRVTVSGSAAGFPNGTRITPWLMWNNSGTWEEQKGSTLTARDGRFSWERKFSRNQNSRTLSVKFSIASNESNSVSMGPVR